MLSKEIEIEGFTYQIRCDTWHLTNRTFAYLNFKKSYKAEINHKTNKLLYIT